MKRTLLSAIIVCIIFSLTGCGSSGDIVIAPVTFEARIFSDPVYDGDIEKTALDAYVVTQGMSPTVQSVFAGIDPVTDTETRAFLDFPLSGPGGVPGNAIIASASLDIVIKSIQPVNGSIPVRIELVSFQPPTLIATDFDRIIQPPLAFTTIVPPISQTDVGRHVSINVTSLMVRAQNLGLRDFQLRILEDLGPVTAGLIEINDTTGASRESTAPLLTVTYF